MADKSISAQTTDTGATADLERCLAMLQSASNDEERFVALLLLPRLLDVNSQKQVKDAFRHMDWQFIERLLQTNTSEESELMRTLAINVISLFARADSSLIQEKALLSRIPSLARSLDFSFGECATDIYQDILEVLARAAALPQGARRLWHTEVLQAVLNQLAHGQSTLALKVLSEILLSVAKLDRGSGSDITRAAACLHVTMPALATLLAERQDAIKFEVLRLLSMIMTQLPTMVLRLLTTDKKALQRFVQDSCNGLGQVLSSKSASAVRDDALVLIAGMLAHFGHEWLFSPVAAEHPNIKPQSQSHISESQFALLVIQLSCIEVRICLDELALKGSPELSSERIARLLPSCYTVIEHTVLSLTETIDALDEASESADGRPGAGTFDLDQLLQVRRTLQGTFEAIIAYVTDQQSVWLEKTGTAADEDSVYIASLRVLCIWLAEDEALHAEALGLMPSFTRMLVLAASSDTAMTDKSLAQRTQMLIDGSSVLGWLGPALVHLLAQASARDAFRDTQGPLLLGQHIAQLWIASPSPSATTAPTQLSSHQRRQKQRFTTLLHILLAALDVDVSSNNGQQVDEARLFSGDELQAMSAADRHSLLAALHWQSGH